MYNSINESQKENTKNVNTDSEKSNDGASIVTQNTNKEILQIIYFDFDESEISNTSFLEVKRFIKKNKDNIKKYIVVGHTDTKGSQKYNMLLSMDRAKTIRKILINLGIKSENIKLIGKGEEELSVQTNDETPHPANRRAEISPFN